MKKPRKGFTLIELVIVITIIAIQRDARIAKASAVLGSLRSAAALARARCELDMAATPVGTCTAASGTANMDGVAVSMINRHPTANAGGIVAAANINAASDGLTISAGGAGAGVDITFDVVGGAVPNCGVTYTSAAADAAPAIALTDIAGR